MPSTTCTATCTLPVEGLQVAYRQAGQGAPLALIHGVGMQSAVWGPQIDAFAASHRVIAVDLPGHGGSDPLPVGSTLKGFVDWFGAFVRALGLAQVSLAGHSMGALIAGGYAAGNPAALSRVALLNPVFRRDETARTAVLARAKAIRLGEIDHETPLARWFGASTVEQAACTQVRGWLESVDVGGYATAYDAFAAGDATYADDIAGIACPLLALTGDGDPNSTPLMAQQMAELAQNGRAVIVEGHRHMVNLTAPGAVNVALSDWLGLPDAATPSHIAQGGRR